MKIAILGNGISGITAARHLRKNSDAEITVISDETTHFYSRTALMYIYMGHMRYEDTKPYEDWFWEKNRIHLIQDRVDSIDFKNKKLELRNGVNHAYDKLILAVGSKSNKFGWPGQDLDGVSGLYHYQDLEKMERFTPGLKRAVIVGGGLIGIEMAEMFHARDIAVTMLVRESNYWDNVLPDEESSMVTKQILKNHIDLRLNTNLDHIIDDGKGKVRGVVIKETQEELACGYVGLTPGVSPNVDFLKETELKIDKGVVVNEFLETNIEGVYAIGDCAQRFEALPGRRPIEAVWYTGRMMGETVAHNILGNKKAYQPGIWFNSAKFIDLEYQVYGDVPREIPEEYHSLFWKNSEDDKSIRINFRKDSSAVVGFNLMGVRYRHEVCDKWIADGTSIEKVLSHLSLANFDPEFFKEYEADVIQMYNAQFGKNLKPKSMRRLNQVLQFLKS